MNGPPARPAGRLAAVATGGAVGSSLRAGVLVATPLVAAGASAGFVAVVVLNLVGAALLGWATARAAADRLGELPLALLGPGIAGALTTFSGLCLQGVRLAEQHGVALASAAVALTVGAGLGVASAAHRRGRRTA